MLKFNKGDEIMGRPIGTNNIMRTSEEKEKIVQDISFRAIVKIFQHRLQH